MSIFTQRIALRIRTYSLDQQICFQIIEENTGFLRLVSGWVVDKPEVSNSQEKWIISVFKKPLGSVP